MNKYTIKYGETLFDVTINIYGKIDYIFNLIELNPILGNITNTGISGLEINYEPIVVTDFKPVSTTSINNNKSVTIKENQSLFDVCLQIFGNIEDVFLIIQNSDVENINDTSIKGIKFNYEYNKTKFAKFFLENSYVISTLKETTEAQTVGFLLQENGYYILQENGYKTGL